MRNKIGKERTSVVGWVRVTVGLEPKGLEYVILSLPLGDSLNFKQVATLTPQFFIPFSIDAVKGLISAH